MRKNPLEKICKKCGKDFKTNDLQGKFCSIKCARAFNNHIYQKYPIVNRVCETCCKSFTSKDHPERQRRYCSRECAGVAKCGQGNINWMGDNVSYGGLHQWVNRTLVRPDRCSKCQAIGKVDAANISNEYKRDVSDWEWLCRKCHMESDGRMNNLLVGKTKRGNLVYPQELRKVNPHLLT